MIHFFRFLMFSLKIFQILYLKVMFKYWIPSGEEDLRTFADIRCFVCEFFASKHIEKMHINVS